VGRVVVFAFDLLASDGEVSGVDRVGVLSVGSVEMDCAVLWLAKEENSRDGDLMPAARRRQLRQIMVDVVY
jgi:hypothetical protein